LPGIVAQMPVAAGMENQRLASLAAGETLDATKEYQVVTARIMCLVAALEPRRAALDEWYAGQSCRDVERAKTILVTAGKTVRDGLLTGGQDINGVMAGLAEGFESGRVACEAPQDQGRVQGNGVEGADGYTDRLTVCRQGRQHGDAGGKAAQRVTKVAADQIPCRRRTTSTSVWQLGRHCFRTFRRASREAHQAIRTHDSGVLRFNVGKMILEFRDATDPADACTKPIASFCTHSRRFAARDSVLAADNQAKGAIISAQLAHVEMILEQRHLRFLVRIFTETSAGDYLRKLSTIAGVSWKPRPVPLPAAPDCSVHG
jgi:hypothetical protein